MTLNPLRQKLQSNQGTLGLWVTMECASITEIAVALNIDWVVVDMEHGHLDYRLAPASSSGCRTFAKTASNVRSTWGRMV